MQNCTQQSIEKVITLSQPLIDKVTVLQKAKFLPKLGIKPFMQRLLGQGPVTYPVIYRFTQQSSDLAG